MRNGFYQLSKLPKIACVSPRIYQTIIRLIKRFIRPPDRSLTRLKHLSFNRHKNIIKSPSNTKLIKSNNGYWSHWFSYRSPKNPVWLWALVKTPEEYWDEYPNETEIRVQKLLFK